jgi:hypothetical protein
VVRFPRVFRNTKALALQLPARGFKELCKHAKAVYDAINRGGMTKTAAIQLRDALAKGV